MVLGDVWGWAQNNSKGAAVRERERERDRHQHTGWGEEARHNAQMAMLPFGVSIAACDRGRGPNNCSHDTPSGQHVAVWAAFGVLAIYCVNNTTAQTCR